MAKRFSRAERVTSGCRFCDLNKQFTVSKSGSVLLKWQMKLTNGKIAIKRMSANKTKEICRVDSAVHLSNKQGLVTFGIRRDKFCGKSVHASYFAIFSDL